MASSELPPQLLGIEKEVRDIFKILKTGFHRTEKMKNAERQSKQLEELTAKMREAKRLIKEFDREMQEDSESDPEPHKLLNERKHSLITELNSYVALRKTYTSCLGNSKRELDLDGGANGAGRPYGLRVRDTSRSGTS